MAVMGGTTLLVSSVALGVVKRVVRARRLSAATPCAPCGGAGYVACDVCRGRRVVSCRAPRSLRQLRAEAGGRGGGAVAPSVDVACPACGATTVQRCLNCLGEGRVCLPA
jgi:predicted RNA-binding Zn-ribbon protein involved in translation (DUF1610 family)